MTTIDLTDLVTSEQLRTEQEQTLRSPRRRYGIAARALFATLNLIYGRTDTTAKFRVLELVARVPYQAWEHVAYIAVTHTHEHPSQARTIHDYVVEARAQQDNEQWHLLILEEVLHAQGHRHRLLRDRVVPQVLAFIYYQLSWLLYVVKPAWSHRLNVDFEDHAEHTYMHYVDDHPELDTQPWHSEFAADYGPHATVGDLFRQIGVDERAHKQHSLDHIRHPRFSAAGERVRADPHPPNRFTKPR